MCFLQTFHQMAVVCILSVHTNLSLEYGIAPFPHRSPHPDTPPSRSVVSHGISFHPWAIPPGSAACKRHVFSLSDFGQRKGSTNQTPSEEKVQSQNQSFFSSLSASMHGARSERKVCLGQGEIRGAPFLIEVLKAVWQAPCIGLLGEMDNTC